MRQKLENQRGAVQIMGKTEGRVHLFQFHESSGSISLWQLLLHPPKSDPVKVKWPVLLVTCSSKVTIQHCVLHYTSIMCNINYISHGMVRAQVGTGSEGSWKAGSSHRKLSGAVGTTGGGICQARSCPTFSSEVITTEWIVWAGWDCTKRYASPAAVWQ